MGPAEVWGRIERSINFFLLSFWLRENMCETDIHTCITYTCMLCKYLFPPELDAQGLPQTPSNIAEFRGNNVELDCWLSTSLISWGQCITEPPGCMLFYLGNSGNEIIIPPGGDDDERYTRYEIIDVTVESGTQKNLRINALQDEDGGKYRCADRIVSYFGFLAEVIVIHGR